MDLKLQTLLKGNMLSGMLKKCLNDIQKKYRLKNVEMEVLYFWAEFPEYDTPSEAARYLQLTRGHVSQAVDALMKAGFISGTVDARDRRSMHYTPTEKAAPLVDEIRRGRNYIEKELFSGVSPSDIETLRRVMIQVEQNGKRLAEQLQETECSGKQ